MEWNAQLTATKYRLLSETFMLSVKTKPK
jgi:hypothetical protein